MSSSSTSSSRRPVPAARAAVGLAAALLTAAGLLAASESTLRGSGLVPSDVGYRGWHWRFGRLREGADPHDALFLGDSRVECGISPEAFDAAARTRSYNFGHIMGAPLLVLEDALAGLRARPPRLLVVGYSPASFFGDRFAGITRVHLADDLSPGERLDRALQAELAERVVVAQQGRLWQVLNPNAQPLVTQVRGPRGNRLLDWPLDPGFRQQAQLEKTQDMPWLLGDGTIPVADSLARYRRLRATCREAGIPLLVVRMPVGEAVRQVEATRYPDSLFQALAGVGVRLLDPTQASSFTPLVPPDGVHLDASQSLTFSAELGVWVQANGLLRDRR